MKLRHNIYITLVCSCCIFYSWGRAERETVREYYVFINKAELAILDTKYQLAGQYYKNAFLLKYPNGKDLYNAFVTAFYNRDTTFAIRYLNDLAYHGLIEGYIHDSVTNCDFYKYIATAYDSCYHAGAESFMPVLGKRLHNIFEDDKKVRTDDVSPEHMKQVMHVDSMNRMEMKQYIEENGFPSFEQKGFWDESSPSLPGPLLYILWHARFDPTVLDTSIQQALWNGDLGNDDWASTMMEREGIQSLYHIKLWEDEGLNLSPAETERINKNRAVMYLESLEDYRKKYAYMKKKLSERDLTKRAPFVLLVHFLIP